MAVWSWEEEDEQDVIGIPGASWTRLSWGTIMGCVVEDNLWETEEPQQKTKLQLINPALPWPLP